MIKDDAAEGQPGHKMALMATIHGADSIFDFFSVHIALCTSVKVCGVFEFFKNMFQPCQKLVGR